MTLRRRDLQSDSDLDSIHNSCDVWEIFSFATLIQLLQLCIRNYMMKVEKGLISNRAPTRDRCFVLSVPFWFQDPCSFSVRDFIYVFASFYCYRGPQTHPNVFMSPKPIKSRRTNVESFSYKKTLYKLTYFQSTANPQIYNARSQL